MTTSLNPETVFPPGTAVLVRQFTARRGGPIEARVAGVVESWQDLPTGSWYVRGRNDRLWLKRLKVRKADGEETLLVVDAGTTIACTEAVKS